jgi:hypothetical protein
MPTMVEGRDDAGRDWVGGGEPNTPPPPPSLLAYREDEDAPPPPNDATSTAEAGADPGPVKDWALAPPLE